MLQRYRGDTFIFPFVFKNKQTMFEVGDVARLGIKESLDSDDYVLSQEKNISEQSEEIQFRFESSETQEIDGGIYLIEVELTKGGITETSFRDKIRITGDVVHE